jgi:hypothetical protein
MVRLHFVDDRRPSVEGVLLGRPNGFFRLAQPTVVQGSGESYEAEGEAWVPRENVLWVQVLA